MCVCVCVCERAWSFQAQNPTGLGENRKNKEYRHTEKLRYIYFTIWGIWKNLSTSPRWSVRYLYYSQEESYRLWCVVVCELETSWMKRPWPTGGLLRQKQTNKQARHTKKGHVITVELLWGMYVFVLKCHIFWCANTLLQNAWRITTCFLQNIPSV